LRILFKPLIYIILDLFIITSIILFYNYFLLFLFFIIVLSLFSSIDITDSIVAMGFPSEGVESMYRNPMKDCQEFFNSRHPGHYKVCSYSSCNSCSHFSIYSVLSSIFLLLFPVFISFCFLTYLLACLLAVLALFILFVHSLLRCIICALRRVIQRASLRRRPPFPSTITTCLLSRRFLTFASTVMLSWKRIVLM
jgi:hypothetical protein